MINSAVLDMLVFFYELRVLKIIDIHFTSVNCLKGNFFTLGENDNNNNQQHCASSYDYN